MEEGLAQGHTALTLTLTPGVAKITLRMKGSCLTSQRSCLPSLSGEQGPGGGWEDNRTARTAQWPSPLPHLGQDDRRERVPAFLSMEGHGTPPRLGTAAWLLALAHLEVSLIQLRGSACQSALRAWTHKPRAWLGVNEPCAHCSAAVLAGPAVLRPSLEREWQATAGREDKQSCPFLLACGLEASSFLSPAEMQPAGTPILRSSKSLGFPCTFN